MSEKFVVGHDENIGKGEHANMPKEVYTRPYPKTRMGKDFEIDDTMTDIDDIEDHSAMMRNRKVSHQK